LARQYSSDFLVGLARALPVLQDALFFSLLAGRIDHGASIRSQLLEIRI
jgi:hypothetical protein